MSAGADHACALRADGEVVCWDGVQPVLDRRRFVESGIGGFGCDCAIDGASEVECRTRVWGPYHPMQVAEIRSQLGLGIAVSCFWGLACVLRPDRTVECPGGPIPELVEGEPVGTFTEVTVGQGYACAARPDGSVACWGDGDGAGAEFPPPGFP